MLTKAHHSLSMHSQTPTRWQTCSYTCMTSHNHCLWWTGFGTFIVFFVPLSPSSFFFNSQSIFRYYSLRGQRDSFLIHLASQYQKSGKKPWELSGTFLYIYLNQRLFSHLALFSRIWNQKVNIHYKIVTWTRCTFVRYTKMRSFAISGGILVTAKLILVFNTI